MSDEATKTSRFLKSGPMDKIQFPPAFCQKLKAVGIDPNDLDKIFDFLQNQCGVTETQCRVMETAQADAYLEWWLRKNEKTLGNGSSSVLESLNKLFPRSDRLFAFALAILALKKRNASAWEVCGWLDEHPDVLDFPQQWRTKGNDRSYTVAFDKSSIAKRDINADLNRTKSKLKSAGWLKRVQ
jgi:hypothetical protein